MFGEGKKEGLEYDKTYIKMSKWKSVIFKNNDHFKKSQILLMFKVSVPWELKKCIKSSKQ